MGVARICWVGINGVVKVNRNFLHDAVFCKSLVKLSNTVLFQARLVILQKWCAGVSGTGRGAGLGAVLVRNCFCVRLNGRGFAQNRCDATERGGSHVALSVGLHVLSRK